MLLWLSHAVNSTSFKITLTGSGRAGFDFPFTYPLSNLLFKIPLNFINHHLLYVYNHGLNSRIHPISPAGTSELSSWSKHQFLSFLIRSIILFFLISAVLKVFSEVAYKGNHTQIFF